ncbi:lipoprotein releasing system transmembrane protein LolE [Neorickettsia risticii str. Illinois]|uniref:Lipoprotein releasing system transmembrane protein LolE n=1 Tax=Neorickettsia risticii (strain Illinois) TaxID=434131 RepID=C6V419_NEORI|nr:lipoprotein-releasing ABC transporter permease subunit [Neorickettsia risticii]ACT69136.1 lipoprotein releasing system transmembrane protein LolE [Neorickettsia risticii str. Illinois]
MFIIKLELELACSYLISKSFRGLVTFLSLVGVAIGVASLIVVTSVMDGFKAELISNIVGVSGHVNIWFQRGINEDVTRIRSIATGIPHVAKVVPALEARAIISNELTNVGVLVRGMELNDFVRESLVTEKIIQGKVADFEDGIVIGARMAEELGVSVGDEVKFLSASYTNTMLGPIPRMKHLKIAAIFALGLVEYDSALVYMPFNVASTFFRSEMNTASIFLDDPYFASDVSERIKQKLPDLHVTNWQDVGNPYFRALKVEKAVMSIVLLMIVLVAAFNIISGLFMLVDEKKQSVAILRTMGMTGASIVRIFIFCGSIIGVVGTGLGVMFGLLIAVNINRLRFFIEWLTGETIFDPSVYFIDKIPVLLDPASIGLIALSTILITFFATIPPAYKASKQSPGSILR